MGKKLAPVFTERVSAVVAYTTHPNTPERDASGFVAHTVEMSDGRKVQVFARGPSEALERANLKHDLRNGK